MAQFHISKDPPEQTPKARRYPSLTGHFVPERHKLDNKYISFWHYDLDQPIVLWSY